jgi:hypothetical protein
MATRNHLSTRLSAFGLSVLLACPAGAYTHPGLWTDPGPAGAKSRIIIIGDKSGPKKLSLEEAKARAKAELAAKLKAIDLAKAKARAKAELAAKLKALKLKKAKARSKALAAGKGTRTSKTRGIKTKTDKKRDASGASALAAKRKAERAAFLKELETSIPDPLTRAVIRFRIESGHFSKIFPPKKRSQWPARLKALASKDDLPLVASRYYNQVLRNPKLRGRKGILKALAKAGVDQKNITESCVKTAGPTAKAGSPGAKTTRACLDVTAKAKGSTLSCKAHAAGVRAMNPQGWCGAAAYFDSRARHIAAAKKASKKPRVRTRKRKKTTVPSPGKGRRVRKAGKKGPAVVKKNGVKKTKTKQPKATAADKGKDAKKKKDAGGFNKKMLGPGVMALGMAGVGFLVGGPIGAIIGLIVGAVLGVASYTGK